MVSFGREANFCPRLQLVNFIFESIAANVFQQMFLIFRNVKNLI